MDKIGVGRGLHSRRVQYVTKRHTSRSQRKQKLNESSGERFNEVQGVVSITALTDDLPKKVARRMEDAVYPEDCEERAAAPRVVGRAGDELGCWARCALIRVLTELRSYSTGTGNGGVSMGVRRAGC